MDVMWKIHQKGLSFSMFEVWNKYIDLKARKTIVSNCILSPDAEFHHDKFELQRDTDDS